MKIVIAQTIALVIIMPIMAFALHGIELSCRVAWKRITRSRAVDDAQYQSTANVASTAQPSGLVAQRPPGRRESKKSRRRRNRLLKAPVARTGHDSKP
jgi:hypothetical protein